MPRDLEQLLRDTAVQPADRPDPRWFVERGRRRRRIRRGVVGAGAVVALGVAAIVMTGQLTQPRTLEVVDEASPKVTPSPAATGDSPDGRAAAAEVVEHATGGRAIVEGFGSVWIAGPLRHDDQQGEWAEVVRSSPDGCRLEAVVEMPAPMTELAVTDNAVWAARAGDGALPQNLLVRIDPTTSEVTDVIDLGEFSTAAMLDTDRGDLLLVSGNGHAPEVMWRSGADGRELARLPLGILENPSAIAGHDGLVAVTDIAGSAVIVTSEEILRTTDTSLTDGYHPLPDPPTDVGFSTGGLWVASGPAQTVTATSIARGGFIADSAFPVSFDLPSPPVTLITDTDAEAARVVTADGTVSFITRKRTEPVPVARTSLATNVALQVGTDLWLVGGDLTDPDDRGVVIVPLGIAPDDADTADVTRCPGTITGEVKDAPAG